MATVDGLAGRNWFDRGGDYFASRLNRQRELVCTSRIAISLNCHWPADFLDFFRFKHFRQFALVRRELTHNGIAT